MNTDTDIDFMLRADALRWRDELDVAGDPAVTSDDPADTVYLDPGRQPKSDSNRRRLLAAAIGIAALVAVTVLGAGLSRTSHRTGTGPAAATASASVDPLSPAANGYLFPGTAPSAATTAQPNSIAGRISMPWELSSISPNGKAITIYYAQGDGYCITAAGIVVQQTSSYVSIQPVSVNHRQSACPTLLKTGWVKVTLDSPLGTRKLLHPAVSKEWQTALQ